MSVKSIKYDKNLTILEGGGGNSIVLTSDDGVQALVVDTKMGSASKQLAASVKAKDVIVVNTHFHRDHIGGNQLFPSSPIIAGAYTQDQWNAMAGTSRYPDKVVRPNEEMLVRIGNEIAHVRNMGRAHTWNDVVVYLENRRFLVTGDIVFHHRHPALFAQGGANVASWVKVIDSLIVRYDAKAVLPGHGDLSDKRALIDMKEYFTSIEAAIGNPDKMKTVREKYGNYPGIPVFATLDKTVAFIENEKKGK